MKEELLHYVWRMRLFNPTALYTTSGQAVIIQQAGAYNTHAGPDFLNAKVKIDDTIWAGNIEMHIKASDWLKHKHHEDRAYDNVILHVVYEEDTPVYRPEGEALPCLELKRFIPQRLKAHYLRLIHNSSWIACQAQITTVADITKALWLNGLAIERLEEKAVQIQNRLEANTGDWETTFYQFLARSFGGKVNAEPMEELAKRTALSIVGKHRDRLFQLEALLFGQSGLLQEQRNDPYPQQLQEEYAFLSKKYSLQPMAAVNWKFLRLRPANFPTIRIAQLATLLYQTRHLLSKTLAAQNIAELENIFDVKLSNYWQQHYTFDKASSKVHKALGKSTIHLIIINTIIPFLFVYGKYKGETALQDRALHFMEKLPPEDNQIIRKWAALGMSAPSALQSQALLQLKKRYCTPRRCLACAIGNAILNRHQNDT
jgi:hypothetical protein